MRRIIESHTGPLDVTEPTTLMGKLIGNVTIAEGADLKVAGEVVGEVVVRRGGALVLLGRIKGGVLNEGGAVDIIGFVGRVSDVGETETYVSRGAIIGGKRASKPGKLSTV
jgi:cytoskeletal protein CcmA (bactofilin family)